jgi:hypothetical protein
MSSERDDTTHTPENVELRRAMAVFQQLLLADRQLPEKETIPSSSVADRTSLRVVGAQTPTSQAVVLKSAQQRGLSFTQPPKKGKGKRKPRPQGRPINRLEHAALKQHALSAQHRGGGDIPLLRAVFYKGTQVPTLRLKTVVTALTGTGTVINTVISVSLALLQSGSDWDDVFDEFRILRARFWYVPFYYHSITTTGGTADRIARSCYSYVDYDDAPAATSIGQVWAFDNAVVFHLTQEKALTPVELDFVPDTQWYNTQTDQGTTVAYLKFYSDAVTNNGTYGQVYGWLDIQFRET